jgi:hypothetical protein
MSQPFAGHSREPMSDAEYHEILLWIFHLWIQDGRLELAPLLEAVADFKRLMGNGSLRGPDGGELLEVYQRLAGQVIADRKFWRNRG